MDRLVTQDVAKGFSGAVLVARDDTFVLDKGYGAIGGRAMGADTKFWIASAGKQFTSVAILKCAERGWLKLEQPISQFFPQLPPDKRAITIRELLAHLSGLDQTYASEGAPNRSQAVARMAAHPLIDRPGHKFHYSNDNYQLAAAIVEVASGANYKDFVKRELFVPARLRNTGFSGDDGAKSVTPAAKPAPARLAGTSWGAEGVYSTTGDLLHWYNALRSGQVISAASAQTLFEPIAPIVEGQTALGWFVGRTSDGRARIFTRGNEDWGPNALLYAYPDSGYVIVVLTHAGYANPVMSWSRFVHAQLESAIFSTRR
jgi:CubicO group peptidase (beta-lactamase class C family)